MNKYCGTGTKLQKALLRGDLEINPRDNLPLIPWRNECGVGNLNFFSGAGTRRVAYFKKIDCITYFNSFGLQLS